MLYLYYLLFDSTRLFQIEKDRKYPCKEMEMDPKHPGIDLIFADALENLPVPGISPNKIPSWNQQNDEYFDLLLCFASYHLIDDGSILLMHPKDHRIERILDDRASAYGFRLVRDWWGYNPLPMASTLPHQREVFREF